MGNNKYLWELPQRGMEETIKKVDGKYADPAMKMVILKSNDIEGSEDLAKELLGSKDSISRKNNGTLIASNKAFILNFDQRKESTVFNVDIKEDGEYIFFTEHMPFEFESDEHFFKNTSGDDVEPVAQEPEVDHHDHGHLNNSRS